MGTEDRREKIPVRTNKISSESFNGGNLSNNWRLATIIILILPIETTDINLFYGTVGRNRHPLVLHLTLVISYSELLFMRVLTCLVKLNVHKCVYTSHAVAYVNKKMLPEFMYDVSIYHVFAGTTVQGACKALLVI